MELSYCGQCRMRVRLNERVLPIQAKNEKKSGKQIKKSEKRISSVTLHQ